MRVRIGRVGKRYEQSSELRVLRAIEVGAGKKFTETEREVVVCGPDEQDFVNSGLEDTMVVAYQRLRDIWKRNSRIPDLRTAAFLDATDKVALSYAELGIFP